MDEQPTFLYLDDDPMARQILSVMFRNAGYSQLVTFADSADFMARVEALWPPPDVFLLDIHIAPYNGFQMLELLRAHESFQNKMVVAVTASVMHDEVVLLQRAGFNGALGKPIDFDNFEPLIKSILAGDTIWHIV